MSSFIRRFSTKEDVEKADKAKLRAKNNAGSNADSPPNENTKANDFDLLLRSGETILLSISPPTTSGMAQRTTVRVGNAASTSPTTSTTTVRDSFETAMDKITRPDPHYRDLQRATITSKPQQPVDPAASSLAQGRRVMSSESLNSKAESLEEDMPGAVDPQQGYLRAENLRLEKRIQELNSELFKERAANAELSSEVKEALSALEKMQAQEAADPPPPSVINDPVRVPAATLSSGPASPASVTPGDSSDWQKRYQDLEARSNALSAKAVQTIQESKLKLTALQRENLELKDQARELQTQLQQHAIEKGRAMSLIPRLVEMVQKLQKEIAEEKQKRQMESEFDDLTRMVQRAPSSS